jgi:hypothetical protein
MSVFQRRVGICLFPVLLAMLFWAVVASAQFLPPGQADFYNTYGVRIGQDLTSVPVGGSLTGVVEDPSALIKHGFTGAKKGDKLMLLNLGQGQWKLKLMSTGTEKPFHLKK